MGVEGNGGGSGDDKVIMSLISSANQDASSPSLNSSSSISEVNGACLLGERLCKSGMDFMKRTDARCDLQVGERESRGLADSSSDVGGVEVDFREMVLDPLAEVWLLDSDGVGDWSLRLLIDARGGEGKSMEIPRPENRKLMSSRGDSILEAAGGAGAGRGGSLERGKKSSKVSPSAPVSTTRRESRLTSLDERPERGMLRLV